MEETGWKLVHGDVFRPPKNPRLFVSLVGSGIQIFCCTGIVISELSFVCQCLRKLDCEYEKIFANI